MDKTSINALVQSIKRSLHLIYKNLFSIKQYQFPQKIGLNLFEESRRTSPLRVRRRLRLHIYPRQPEVMVERDREWRCVSLSVRPTRTKLDYGHGNISYQTFSSAAAVVMNTVTLFFSGTGEEKMDLDIFERDLSCLKATPKADISSPQI